MNIQEMSSTGRIVQTIAFAGVIIASFLLGGTSAHAVSISATTTTENITTIDDQTASTATTTDAVMQVLAEITLDVNAVPTDSETMTVGTCVVTFSTVAGSTADETNCGDDAATVDLDTGAGDAARNESDVSTVIAALTNVSDADHGTLEVISTTTASTTFSGVASTTATSTIIFTDGTSGDIATSSQVFGVVGVIQVSTLTIGGTVEEGDIFTATLPTVGDVPYTASSTDSTASDIANGLLSEILASAGYATQAFTAATSSNTIVYTGKATGTSFAVTSDTTNAAPTAQVSEITPSDVESGYIFTVTINSTDYSYTSTDNILGTVVEGIHSALSGASEISCTEDDVEIICTAVTAGTSFTISVSVSAVSSSGGGGVKISLSDPDSDDSGSQTSEEPGGASEVGDDTNPITNQQETIRILQEQILALIPIAQQAGLVIPQELADFASNPLQATQVLNVRDLTIGDEGEDVVALQTILISLSLGEAADSLGAVGATGYFGPLTQTALAEYQLQNGVVPDAGYFGPLTRERMQITGVKDIWW